MLWNAKKEENNIGVDMVHESNIQVNLLSRYALMGFRANNVPLQF